MNIELTKPQLMLVTAIAIGALIGGGMSSLPFVFGLIIGMFVPIGSHIES